QQHPSTAAAPSNDNTFSSSNSHTSHPASKPWAQRPRLDRAQPPPVAATTSSEVDDLLESLQAELGVAFPSSPLEATSPLEAARSSDTKVQKSESQDVDSMLAELLL
ncbi:unnamed protein product, partial [Polarella glacialis]